MPHKKSQMLDLLLPRLILKRSPNDSVGSFFSRFQKMGKGGKRVNEKQIIENSRKLAPLNDRIRILPQIFWRYPSLELSSLELFYRNLWEQDPLQFQASCFHSYQLFPAGWSILLRCCGVREISNYPARHKFASKQATELQIDSRLSTIIGFRKGTLFIIHALCKTWDRCFFICQVTSSITRSLTRLPNASKF